MRRSRPTFLDAWRSLGLVFGGVFLLVGIPFFLIGGGTALEERRYTREGIVVEGIVLTKDLRRSRNDGRTYRVRYRFITQDGDEVEGGADVGLATWERLTERGPVPIVYLAGRPRSSRVLGESQWVLPAIFLILGGALSLLGGSVFVRGMLQAWARVRRRPG